MNKIKFKNYILNFLTVIISTFLGLLIANIIFISVSTQNYFPRSLAGSLPNILLTFYPDTYNKDNLKDYVAITGDSYSQGGGDAYLNGMRDYTFAHHLHKNDNKNYLNFGRAGYGSISAVSNLIMINKLTYLPNLIEDLEKPKSIIFIFYEGNDLEENFFEYNLLSKSNENASDFVSRRIKEKIKLSNIDKLTNIFPILTFLKKLYSHLHNLLKKIIKVNDLNEVGSLITNRIKKLFGYTIVLNDSKVDPLTYTNSIKNHNKIDNIRPLQSAAVGLTKKEISIALEVFFESMKHLKSWSQAENITILYVPSPISSYAWEEPITYEFKTPSTLISEKIKKTSNKKNSSNSIFIRNKINYFSKENNFQFLDATNYVIEKGKEIILHGPLDWRHFNYEGYKNVSNYIIDNTSSN